jgi:hypothetical protein
LDDSNRSDESSVLEKIEDEALNQTEKKKKAKRRTRGPYRKADIKTQRL